MALTVLQCADWIRLTLGGKPDAVLPTLQLVNMTGKHLVSMTSWRYLEGVALDLDTVASQEYIDLPTNFAAPISIESVSSANPIVWTTREALNVMRSTSSVTSTNGYTWVAVETVAASGSTPPTTRLAIYPTPADTATGVYHLVYRAGWANLTSESDFIPIPVWAETLFVQVLKSFARGLQREEEGSADDRLAAIQQGIIFRNAMREDRTKQTDHGQIRGAIHQRRSRFRIWPFSGLYSTGP